LRWLFTDAGAGTATACRIDGRGFGVSAPVEQNISVLHVVQTGSGAHPASYPMGTGGKAAGACSSPRGGSRIGTVELQHPLCHLILSITYNRMSPFFFNSFYILVLYIILQLNVSSHPPVYEKHTIFWSSTPTNFSYEPPLRHHSPSSSAEVKNTWTYTSTPPYAFMALCLFSQAQIYLHLKLESMPILRGGLSSMVVSTVRLARARSNLAGRQRLCGAAYGMTKRQGKRVLGKNPPEV
jgi:hypothetical protein